MAAKKRVWGVYLKLNLHSESYHFIPAIIHFMVPNSQRLKQHMFRLFPSNVPLTHTFESQLMDYHGNKIRLFQKRALMYFREYKSHVGQCFISSRWLPLDFLYFKSVAVLMHDISSNLLPPYIAKLFISTDAFIHISQGHLQVVTILLNPKDLTDQFYPFQEN